MTRKKSQVLVCAVLFCITSIMSCKKDTLPASTDLAALNIVNALPASLPLIPVTGTTFPVRFLYNPGVPESGSYQNLRSIGSVSYGSNALLSVKAGIDTVYLAQKNSDTLSNNKGTLSKYMFNSVLNLSGNTAYSLFITGSDTTSPDFLFVQDNLPYHSSSDSTVGIRFANLSANSAPVSLNIQGQPYGGEVSSLAYKGITGFKNYAATFGTGSYVFEFRDAGTGSLLTTYTLNGVNTSSTTIVNNVRFKDLTIALIGQPSGGTAPQRAILINNY